MLPILGPLLRPSISRPRVAGVASSPPRETTFLPFLPVLDGLLPVMVAVDTLALFPHYLPRKRLIGRLEEPGDR
jgi:hypothetical protein